MEKSEIVAVLEEIAVLLDLKGENPFKIRAYSAGARLLEELEEDLGKLIEEDRLGDVKGLGKALVEKITELHETGRLEYYEKLKASVPPGLLRMLEISGFGPKKVKKVYEALGVDSIESLRAACEAGKVSELPGFGAKTETNLLRAIENLEKYNRRHLWWDVRAVALPILDGLRELGAVERAEVAGSFRRNRETVGDLDFIVGAVDSGPVMDWFAGLPDVAEVIAKGETKTSVRFSNGMQADLRVVPPAQFAFALHHFTGSKDHNVQMRQRALAQGYSLSEWGLFPKDADEATRKSRELHSEESIFEALGLHFIPPELREGRDELAYAEEHRIPRLIEPGDIRGAFHNHTTASDGRDTLEDMARAAAALGWEYLGIADHSKASWQARGLQEDQLREQVARIREWNTSENPPIHLFAGSEVDILKDGSLDFSSDLLDTLDYVVLSVHVSMTGMDEKAMTERIIRALETPLKCRKMLGHATGRLLLRREGYGLQIPRIIDAAAANDVAIELNAHPRRLDLDWRHWRRALEKGVTCVINPDAHSATGLALLEAGVRIARKARIEPHEVLNTRNLAEVRAWLGV